MKLWTVLLLAFVALWGCTAPGPDPVRYGVVKVAFGAPLDPTVADWREDQRLAIEPIARELDALGPDFQWVSAGDPEAIVIRPAALEPGVCGYYRLGESMVQVDPACSEGFSVLRKAAAHEVVHAFLYQRFRWSGHLCWYPLNDTPPPTCHRSMVCQNCLMSPALQGRDEWADGAEDYSSTVVFSEPQPGDIALVSHCFSAGTCE